MLLLFLIFLANQMQLCVIEGTVLDPNDRPVANVRVEIQPGGQILYTGADGGFRAHDLPPGEYTVTAFHRDFEPAEERVRIGPGTAGLRLSFRALRPAHMQIDVIGGDAETALRDIPGSAFLVSREELAEQHAADANEILRLVPGLHVREDSGPVGMRLNIGLRGLNPDRSRTLLVLEDGLPIALAPYGEPEMYYSPPIDRMSRLEVLKGSGSIVHGPQTVGGVLNFITPDPPIRPQATLELTAGQRGVFVGQASYGGTKGRTGWLVNALRKQGDGWRSFYYGINDVLSKLNFALSHTHRLGLKLGVYDERSNSTYLGLTESQFRADPNTNLVPGDLLRVRRYSGSALHQFVASPRALISTGLFGYTTIRNWRRQDFDRVRTPGTVYVAINGDESIPGDAIFLRDSSTSNNREFDVIGAESRLSFEHSLLRAGHSFEAGLRYIHEQHRDARVDLAGRALTGVTREYEVRHGGAVSVFLQDRIRPISGLAITPGLRLEKFDYIRDIRRQPVAGIPTDVNIRSGDGVVKPIPGLGAALQLAPPLTLFAGAHRGFAPPRVKDAITRSGVSLQLDAELSWNYEAGARLRIARGLRAESTFFVMDFENQIIPAAQSGGATTTLINGGRTLHRGLETAVAADWAGLTGSPRLSLWAELRHSYLPVARFTSGIYRGNRLPYAPETTLAVRMGYRHRRGFCLQADGTRVGTQFGDNNQTVRGSADGTIGLLPSYWVWNLAAGHELRRERWTIRPFVTVKNLGDARYISSRAPLGIQPGMFRQLNAGLKIRF